MDNGTSFKNLAERIATLEERTSHMQREHRDIELMMRELRLELRADLQSNEKLMRQLVSELRSQHTELKEGYTKMNAAARGIVWVGGAVATVFVTITAVWDKLSGFFS